MDIREDSDQSESALKAARLAPPEEQVAKAANRSANNGGAIVVDTGSLNIPKGFIETEKAKPSLYRLEPVVIAILIVFLAFIAFIAWQITLMEPPAK